MHVDFLTPAAAAVGAGAVVPLVAWAVAERRVARTRRTLELAPPARRAWWPSLAIASTLALLALAAAQPVVSAAAGHARERTGQVFVVVDTSESMRAGRPTRFARALDAAEQMRTDLRGIRVGLASATDRVLPHLFPTIDEHDFRVTLRNAVGIDRPPPSKPYREATGFDELRALANAGFFGGGGPNVVVLLTDGESRGFSADRIAHAFRHRHMKLVVVRFWKLGERIRGDPGYVADPDASAELDALARAMGIRIYGERDLGAATDAVRAGLRGGRAVPPARRSASARPLAPYAALAALFPLGLLLWRRNLR